MKNEIKKFIEKFTVVGVFERVGLPMAVFMIMAELLWPETSNPRMFVNWVPCILFATLTLAAAINEMIMNRHAEKKSPEKCEWWVESK